MTTTYRSLKIAQSASVVGTQMLPMTLLLHLYDATSQTSEVGHGIAVFVAASIATLLMIGVVIDTSSPKTVALVGLLCGLFLSFTLLERVGALQDDNSRLIVLVLLGSAGAAIDASERALIRVSVSETDLPALFAWNASRMAAGQLLGPAVAGLLHGLNPAAPVYFIVGSFATSFAALLRVPGRPHAYSEKHQPAWTGLLAVFRRRDTSSLILLMFSLQLSLLLAFNSALLALQKEGESSFRLGLLETFIGLGALLGSFATRRVVDRVPTKKIVVSVSAYFASVLVIGSFYSTWLTFACILTLAAAPIPVLNTSASTYTLTRFPPERSGAVSAIWLLCVRLGGPVAPVLAAWYVTKDAVRAAWLSAAVLCFICIPIALLIPGRGDLDAAE
jgi:MFS family permease